MRTHFMFQNEEEEEEAGRGGEKKEEERKKMRKYVLQPKSIMWHCITALRLLMREFAMGPLLILVHTPLFTALRIYDFIK